MPQDYDYVFRFSEPSAPSTWYYIGGTLGNPTSGSDTPANTYIPNNLLRMPSFKLMLFQGIDPKPDPVLAFGTLSLANADGYLDQYMTKVFDGGTLQVLRGTKGAAVSTFSTVATFTTAGYLCDKDSFDVRVRDLSHFLRESPLHENKYAGTGGAEGPSQIAGRLKPYMYGNAENITPAFIDPTNLIWQASYTPITSIDVVYDGGSEIVPSGSDYANYAALAAAAVTGGQYSTCIAEGMFKLGTAPTFDVTCAIHGDKTGGSALTKIGDAAKAIVTRSAPALTAGQVSSSDVSALNTAYSSTEMSLFFDTEITKAEALSLVMGGICGYWYVDLTGVLRLGYLTKPTGAAAVTFTFPHQADLPELVAYQVPRYKTRLLYAKNYSITPRSALATGIAEVVKQYFESEGIWAEASTASQRTYWPTSKIVDIDSRFWTSGATEATRQQAMFQGVPTDSRNIELWAMQIDEDPYTLAGYLGQIVSIANMDRFGWANPRKFNMVGIDWIGDLTPTIYLWG